VWWSNFSPLKDKDSKTSKVLDLPHPYSGEIIARRGVVFIL
jgi:hypothetical protein